MGSDDEFDERWDGASIPSHHWHLHRRLLERYHVVLAPGEFSKFVTDIRKKRAHLVENRKNRSAIYCVRIDSAGIYIFLVTNDGHPISVLPPSDSWKRKVIASVMRMRAVRREDGLKASFTESLG